MVKQKLILHFTNKDQTSNYQLTYILKENAFVEKWLILLKQTLDSKTEIKDGGGFYGSGIHDPVELRNELNRIVSLLNSDRPSYLNPIDANFPEVIDQQFLNHLHNYFEEWSALDDYHHGTHGHMRSTLDDLNTTIHQYESTFGRGSHYFSVTVNFASSKEMPFEEDDYHYFTPNRQYGELYLNYATIGVGALEAFQNKSQTKPVPQRTYRADFNLHFDPTHQFSRYEELKKWLADQFDINAEDKKIALGYISLGQLEAKRTTQEELFLKIREHRQLKKIDLLVSRE